MKAVRIADCEIAGAGGNGIALESCDGEVTHLDDHRRGGQCAVLQRLRGLMIAANIDRKIRQWGLRLWQGAKRHDGSMIADNRIDDTSARAGGTGQNGNAINVFRAGDVVVRGNHIRNAAFSAIRGNAGSNIQISATTAPRSTRWRSIPSSVSRAR